ncbi:MAG: class E sortase [Acidimicrobiia bacterium]
MRLVRSAIRFMAAFGLVVVACIAPPADAVVAPAHAVPAASRQPTSSPSQESGVVVSHLRIPSIGVDEEVRSGISLSVINQGVAHWAGTSAPGGSGNMVLAGHRTTYTRPFADLDRLEVGDLVYLEDGDGFDVMYRVSDIFIVSPEDIWISYDLGRPMVTMFACHPKGSARERIVVQAELVAGRRVA